MTKRPHKTKGLRVDDLLELVHPDIPMRIQALGGYEYFITFIDDYSGCDHVYLLHHKSESSKIFKEFKTKVDDQLGKNIKSSLI